MVDAGGMGAIFHGQHGELGTRVAIKVLLAGDDAPPEVVVRFLNEARIGATVVHPNIARTIDLFRDERGRSFIVMEWLDGESLARRLDRGPCEHSEATGIFLGVCRGLSAAHRASVVHRDIKPGNIFLAREHEEIVPKLIDFGIARLTASSSHTRTGLVMGSPPYMSPEQWKGAKHVTVKSDVYALGVVFYEMLTGTNPFNGETLPEISMKVTTQRLPPHPRVPSPLYEVLLEATTHDVSARIATLAEFTAKVSAAGVALSQPGAGGLPTELPRSSPKPPKHATLVAPTFRATVPQAPVQSFPVEVPRDAAPSLIDDHVVDSVSASLVRSLGAYLTVTGPIAVGAAVLAGTVHLGASFVSWTGATSTIAMLAIELTAAAVLSVATFLVARVNARGDPSRLGAALESAALLVACWAVAIMAGELWAALHTALSGMSWRRDPIRREVFHLGLDAGVMWLVGLLLGGIVTWVRAVDEDEPGEFPLP
jgi:serine/threonine protein kinase